MVSHNNAHRLARAREILTGAECAMGITSLHPDLQDASKAMRKTPSWGVFSIPGAQGEFNAALSYCAQPHSWIAVASLPEIGWERVEERGICLDRVVVIPSLDIAPERVLYTLVAVMDIVCVGEASLNTAARKRITAKARQKGCLILTTTPWAGLSRPFPPDLLKRHLLMPSVGEMVAI